jgi:hypothetical protein
MSEQHSRLAVLLGAVFLSSSALADIQFSSIDILVADSVQKFAGMRQYGVLLGYRVNSWSRVFWMPSRLDFSAGWLERGSNASAFVSAGPSYRWHMNKSDRSKWFVDFGVHATFISRSRFEGKNLGGEVFFTSHLGLGVYLGRQRKSSLLLRFQHISNAGLNDSNPGVDMLGLAYSYNFGGDRMTLSADNADQK